MSRSRYMSDIYYNTYLYVCVVAIGFIWVVKNCSCYKMLNDRFENWPKCESPANENGRLIYFIRYERNITQFNGIWRDRYIQEICKRAKVRVRVCIIDDGLDGQRAQCVANYIVHYYKLYRILRHVVNFNVRGGSMSTIPKNKDRF